MKIKNNLNMLITFTNTSKSDLAKKSNVTPVALYKYLKNENTPNVDTAVKIIKYFEKEKGLYISLDEFYNLKPINQRLKDWISNNIDLRQASN